MATTDKFLSTLGKNSRKRVEIDKQKIIDDMPAYQQIIAYWRKYPDRFIDFMCGLNPENTFHFYAVQRLVLRIMMRYKNAYLVFSRGFSKSFLAIMALIIKAILYPGASLAIVAGQKDRIDWSLI